MINHILTFLNSGVQHKYKTITERNLYIFTEQQNKVHEFEFFFFLRDWMTYLATLIFSRRF